METIEKNCLDDLNKTKYLKGKYMKEMKLESDEERNKNKTSDFSHSKNLKKKVSNKTINKNKSQINLRKNKTMKNIKKMKIKE